MVTMNPAAMMPCKNLARSGCSDSYSRGRRPSARTLSARDASPADEVGRRRISTGAPYQYERNPPISMGWIRPDDGPLGSGIGRSRRLPMDGSTLHSVDNDVSSAR